MLTLTTATRRKVDVVAEALALTEIGHYHRCWRESTDRLRSAVIHSVFIQHFNTVDWVTGTSSGLEKFLHEQAQRFLGDCGLPGRTWSDVQKNSPVKLKMVVV